MRAFALFLPVAALLTLSVCLAQVRAGTAPAIPLPQARLHGRAADRFDDRYLAPAGREEPSPAGVPSAIPAWTRVVFQSLRDGNWEIYLYDGSTQTRLTNDPAPDIHPSLNRGCTRVAFASRRTGSFEIYTMNVDGSGLTRLTYSDQDDINPTWSPDGTRIAFESYRDGQGEIYVMNADGSNVSRLTWDPAWDGEPAWSPDGSQIAFSSERGSTSRIWRMNADGSNPVPLSNQPYSENPTWSASGKIAYDADGDGDGWLELWTMNADGTGQALAFKPPQAYTDAYAGSWSPDGRHVVFAYVSWVYYQGHWYWTTSYLDAWDSLTGSVVRLVGQGTDMSPDWQTADPWPPTSSVSALPVQSPSPFTVSWSGWDQGPSGLASYDVQVRDGAGGVWTDWLLGTQSTSGSYPGLGGHTYYFRCRARDNAGNVEAWPADAQASTTVEALPPMTAVEALPPFSRQGYIVVRWSGTDPGGSGIDTYDVQRRDGAGGTWTDWVEQAQETRAKFFGLAGDTYYLRSRGTDRAGNVEAWPPGDGDTSTTVYAWKMSGKVHDNRGTPVMGVEVSLDPEPMAVIPSDAEGYYEAYEGTVASSYLATWEKAGYGDLPQTAVGGIADAWADVALPPADNSVRNWGFETGSLEPEWLAEGELEAGVDSGDAHSGDYAAFLGREADLFKPWVNISNTAGWSILPAVKVDGTGTLHVAWQENDESGNNVFYALRGPGGNWSTPDNLSGNLHLTASQHPQLAVHADGTAHVTWRGMDEMSNDFYIYYSKRTVDGTWFGPGQPAWGHTVSGFDMALSPDGALHLVWETTGESRVYYRRGAPDGTWSSVVHLSQGTGSSVAPQVAAGPDGAVHVVWSGQAGSSTEVFYAHRGPGGTWSAPLNLSNSPGDTDGPAIGASADGSVYAAWWDDASGVPLVQYARRAPDGTWSAPVDVSELAPGTAGPTLVTGADGSVHLAWLAPTGLNYARRGADGVWSLPERVGNCWAPHLSAAPDGSAHVVCTAAGKVLYTARIAGVWSGGINLTNSATDWASPALVIDAEEVVHVVWSEGQPAEIAYTTWKWAGAAETGDAIVSQELAVPPAGQAPTLSFWYRLVGFASSGVSWFSAQVDDGATLTEVFTAAVPGHWTHVWVDLAPWAGQTVTLRFLVHQTEGQPAAWAYLDEVSVGSAYPDLWVALAVTSPTVPPGGQVEYTITYGNRGGTPAASVVLTDTLPAGLAFISADPPPATVTPFLTWVAGDLPARSGPFTITLVAGPAPGSGTLTNTVDIGSASAELETLNNRAQAMVRVGVRIALPLLMRNW